jgi:L-alanine-DL-glutamate epimerase-like enolase superfamily enzyme
MVKELAQRIIGRDPPRVEELRAEMRNRSFWAKGGGLIVLAGISVIEQALWDIKGKALGPVRRRQSADVLRLPNGTAAGSAT